MVEVDGSGQVDHHRTGLDIQCQGINGDQISILCAQRLDSQGPERVGVFGQRDSDCLFKGFGETSRIAGSNSAHVELDLAEEHQYESDSSCWSTQQGSGCFVEEISNRSRLDVESHGLFVDRSEMGSYGNRSFCRPDEHEVSNISVLGPGSELSGSGCSPSRLGAVPSAWVLLPSMASDSSLSGQALDSTVSKPTIRLPVGTSLVEGSSLVPEPQVVRSGVPVASTGRCDSGFVGVFPNQRGQGDATASRGESITQSLRDMIGDSSHERAKRAKVNRFQAWLLAKGLVKDGSSLRDFLAEAVIGSVPADMPTYQHFRNFVAAIDEDRNKRVSFIFASTSAGC